MAVCIDSDKLSHAILAAMYLANHSAGGKSSDTSQGWMRIAAGLCSPNVRIAIEIGAAIYPLHAKAAAMADGKSSIDSTLPFGSLQPILPYYERKLLESFSSLVRDWKAFLPATAAFIRTEAARGSTLKVKERSSAEAVQLHWDNLMRHGLTSVDAGGAEKGMSMMAKARRYLCEESMKPGWSICHALEENLGPHFAKALLDFLLKRMRIPEEVLEAGGEEIPWTVDSGTHAYPGLTWREYEDNIFNSFEGLKAEHRGGLLDAYALENPTVIAELQVIEAGGLRQLLRDRGLESCPTGDTWGVLKGRFPALCDLGEQNFNVVPVVTTAVENIFSIATAQKYANACLESTDLNLRHQVNVTMASKAIIAEVMSAKRSLRVTERAGEEGEEENAHEVAHNTKRACRNNESEGMRSNYIHEVVAANSREAGHVESRVAAHGLGKRVKAIVSAHKTTVEELHKNAKHGGNVYGAAGLLWTIGAIDAAHFHGSSVIEKQPQDPLEAEANLLSMSVMRAELEIAHLGDPLMLRKIKRAKKNIGDSDSTEYESLTMLWIQWKRGGVRVPEPILAQFMPPLDHFID